MPKKKEKLTLEEIKLFLLQLEAKKKTDTKEEIRVHMEIVSKQLKTSDTGAMVQATVLNNVSLRILINGFAMHFKP